MSHISLPRRAVKRKVLVDTMRSNFHEMETVCEDHSDIHGPTVWKYLDGVYYRFNDKRVVIARITGGNLPDPDKLAMERERSARAFIKHVSAEKIEKIAGREIEKGKNPEKALIESLTKTRPVQQATKALYQHWRNNAQ